MTTLEEQNKIENNEILATTPEKIEEKEISSEEFLEIANTEEQNFKQETTNEIGKLNSVDLDHQTFENIKKETGIEQELGTLGKEVEQLILQAKQNAKAINSYDAIPETVDYFLNNVSNENRNHDAKFKEAEKLIKKIQDTNEEIWETNKKSKEKSLQEIIDKEPDSEMKEIIKETSYIEAYADPVSQPELFLNSYKDRVNTVFNDVLKQLYPNNSYVERSDRERIKEKIERQVKTIYESKFPGSLSSNFLNEEHSKQDNNQESSNNKMTETGQEKNIGIKKEEQPVNNEYNEILLLGKKLSDFPEAVQEKYKASVGKYSNGLNNGMKEKDENGLTLVDKIKNTIRSDYNTIMDKLGILSSPAGASDNWIYWDLGKQSYLSEHPDESSENYNLSNPFNVENNEIIKDIVNRHVGWEVLGYIKNNPEFLNSLNNEKDSYLKIISLIKKSQNREKIHSYELSNLGKLIVENKN